MREKFLTVIVSVVLALTLPLQLFAGQLDDYYLAAFALQAAPLNITALQKSLLLPAAEPGDMPHCGTPLKKSLRRDWNLLEQTTQKVLTKQLAKPVLSGEQTYLSPTGKFRIHYTMTGSDAVPSLDWVKTVAQTFDDVAASYTSLQWQPAPTSGDASYDVYLRNLASAGYYGVTNSDQAASTASYPNAYTSWMELDNNFTDSLYKPATYSPLQSLQVTAAHEYHHAIQFGYNYYFDTWYAEATSTWMEDELYDSVNQLYSYIPAWFTNSKLSLDIPDSTSTGGGYGRWIFNRYLSEKHGSATALTVWENLAAISSPNGSDISMTPVLDGVLTSTYSASLGNDFFGFAKRVYTRDWTAHRADTADIHPYSPVATYSTYPVNSATVSSPPSVNLPHYSFAYYKFTPSGSVSPDLFISVSGTDGISAAVFKKSAGIITEVLPDTNGKLFTITGFSGLNPTADEVVLLIVNTTSLDNQTASFSLEISTIPGDCDSDSAVSITEVQNAISMFLGIESVGGCVDSDNNSSVSINEVQKVINRFLKL